MKYLKYLICLIKALPLWFRTGYFIPHLYEGLTRDAIIIATSDSFRVAEDYTHTAEETVYPDAVLEECTCVFCGHKVWSWYASKGDMMQL